MLKRLLEYVIGICVVLMLAVAIIGYQTPTGRMLQVTLTSIIGVDALVLHIITDDEEA